MNEISIFYRLNNLFNESDELIKKMRKIAFVWLFYAISMMVLGLSLNFPLWLTMLITFGPLIPIIVFFVIGVATQFKNATKYPLYYNNWRGEDAFVQNVKERSRDLAQPDRNKIKMPNYALDYIDRLIRQYGDDKMKLSNSIYNAIVTTSLTEEVKYMDKFEKFKRHMNEYRGKV